MQKIIFDDDVIIYKNKINLYKNKKKLLNESNDIIKSNEFKKDVDVYLHKSGSLDLLTTSDMLTDTELNKILKIGINSCIEIYKKTNNNFNHINFQSWINVIKHNEPVQFKDEYLSEKYHSHVDLNRKTNSFQPTFTFVYYIQMPNNLSNDDGVLYLMGKNKIEHFILPIEDEMIIMNGDLLHSPMGAKNSTLDRIVMAGNVGFDYIKTKNSIF